MTLTANKSSVIKTYGRHLDRLQKKGVFAGQPEEYAHVRHAAMAAFTKHGFPHRKQEEWRNTSLAALQETEYLLPEAGEHFTGKTPFYHWADGTRIVIANGRVAAGLSNLEGLPRGVRVESLADALSSQPERTLNYLSKAANYASRPLIALNTALWSAGVFVEISAGVTFTGPIQIIYLQTSIDQPVLSLPRTLVVAGENSQVTILEQHMGQGEATYWADSVTEILLDRNASMDYILLQQETPGSFQTHALQAELTGDSSLSLHTVTLGGGLVRNDTSVRLAGEGAEAYLGGLYLAGSGAHVDNHTKIEHAVPNTSSREVYKGILDGHGHGIFNGLVVVQPEAQQINADQRNNNLMLSDDALVHCNPQLEIYADDVKCSHGSTVGRVDDESLFYLRTRGIDEESALRLMINGYAGEVTSRIGHEGIREHLDQLAQSWIDGEDTASE